MNFDAYFYFGKGENRMSVLEYIGNTPTVRLRGIERAYGLCARLYAKLEYFNPFGSLKDRAALDIIDGARARGELVFGGEIVEATSGNMGIALSAICAIYGYGARIVMPENMSRRRMELIRAYGAELVLTSAVGGMTEARETARQIAEGTVLYTDQFNNRDGVLAHVRTTAPELDRALSGEVDAVVCGIGTGATAQGIAEYFRGRATNIIGVEPARSPVITQGRSGKHGIAGIGSGFLPPLYDEKMIKNVLTVDDDEATLACRELVRHEGLLVGISSGAVLAAAIRLANEIEYNAKNIVLILPDNGERYL